MSPPSKRKPALGQRSTLKKHTLPRSAVQLSLRYGHVILISGYIVLTGVN